MNEDEFRFKDSRISKYGNQFYITRQYNPMIEHKPLKPSLFDRISGLFNPRYRRLSQMSYAQINAAIKETQDVMAANVLNTTSLLSGPDLHNGINPVFDTAGEKQYTDILRESWNAPGGGREHVEKCAADNFQKFILDNNP